MSEGELKKRIHENYDVISKPVMTFLDQILDEVKLDLSIIEKLSITNPILVSDLLEIKTKFRKWFGEIKK